MSSKARIFISCGQQTEELSIAEIIQIRLIEMGFEVYVAKKDHVLACLTSNIFDKLENSEYFLFIDFKREKLIKIIDGEEHDEGKYRGSLFTNQELAIATFLKDIQVLGFQEKGLCYREGILPYTQINPIEFDDRDRLPDLVIQKVIEKGWKNNWRNELQMSFREHFDEIDRVALVDLPSRWFHIRVKNLNKRKVARNCIAYVERIKHIESGRISVPDQIELKWAVLTPQSISIAPNSERKLDAFWYAVSDGIIKLGINSFLVDNNQTPLQYMLGITGTYEIDYVVYSDNYSPSRMRLKINKTEDLDQYSFEQIQIS
jgi:hypothetical protein